MPKEMLERLSEIVTELSEVVGKLHDFIAASTPVENEVKSVE